VSNEGIFRAGFVNRSDSGDVYYTPTILDSDIHTSRHRSGDTHTKSRIRDIVLGKHVRQRLDDPEFSFEIVTTSSLTIDSLPLFRQYDHSLPTDALFAFDLRTLPPGTPNLSIWLVSPQHFDQVTATVTHLDIDQFYVNRYVEPWLVLVIFVPVRQT
jgi:hypothetical protein